MAMQRGVFLLICLSCAAHGTGVQSSNRQLSGHVGADSQKTFLSNLLLALRSKSRSTTALRQLCCTLLRTEAPNICFLSTQATLTACSHAATSRTPIITMAEGRKTPGDFLSKIPFRSIFPAFITVQTGQRLVNELPGLTDFNPELLGTAIDLAFFLWGVRLLLIQAGVLQDDASTMTNLAGLKLCVTLNIGREPGTWMPEEWAASGARLSLPMNIDFSDEIIDLGYPGEEALGGRYAKRLRCEGGSFVGLQGEVVVKADGGAWATLPTGRNGQSKMRFFLNLPEGASRNDVSIPAGRVYFSSTCFDSKTVDSEFMRSLPLDEILETAGGIQFVPEGGVTIKRNDAKNLYGIFGDVNLILGSFSIKEVK